MKRLILLLLPFALMTSGCKTTPPPAIPDSSHGISVQERSADFYDGKPRPIPADAYRPRVDYQSELRIIPDTNGLFAAMNSSASVLPPLTAEQQDRLNKLGDLLQAAQKYLQDAGNFVSTYDQMQNAPLTVEDQNKLKNLINAQGRSEASFLRLLIVYVDARTKAEHPEFTRSQIIRARDQATGPSKQPLFAPGKDLDFAALSDFIAGERVSISSQLASDATMVRDLGSVSLRMRATLQQRGQPEIPVHILNYDTISDANVIQEPRISFQMSDADRQRLTAETKVNVEIVELSRNLQSTNSKIRQSLNSLLDAFHGDMTSWKQTTTNLDQLNEKLSAVISALDQTGATNQLQADQKAITADASSLFTTVTNEARQLRDSINILIQPLATNTDSATALVDATSALFKGLGGLPKFSQDITLKVGKTFNDLEQLVSNLATNPPSVQVSLKNLTIVLAAGAPSSAEAVTNLLGTITTDYPNLVAEAASLRFKTQIAAATTNLPPIQLDPNLLDVAAAHPPDGFISLRKNVISGNTTLTLNASLVARNGTNATPEATSVAHQEFDVEKFGLLSTWSANLIFVYRLGNLGANEQKVQFSPSPSISWTIHYNPPPDPALAYSPPNKLWQTLDPGAGLNVSALNWDNSVQLGLGGQVTFFHDLISAGGGYNLNESHHGGYVFIGLGLFQALNQLGITGANFPLGR